MALAENAKTDYERHVEAAVEQIAKILMARIIEYDQRGTSNFLVIGVTTTDTKRLDSGWTRGDDALVKIFDKLENDDERAETLRRTIENYRNVAIKIAPIFVDDEHEPWDPPYDGIDHEEWFREDNFVLEVSWGRH